MAKYLLLKHYRGAPAPVNDVPMDQWTPDEVEAHIRFMNDFAARLESSGEFVDGQALSPDGVWVRYDGEGRPPVTDGPFAETKDLIAGWMVIDVDSYERAIELAGELSAAPGAGGEADPRMAGGPTLPDRTAHRHPVTVDDVELRELVPRVLSVLVRRGADFATAEDAVQEALIRALSAWGRRAPPTPRGGSSRSPGEPSSTWRGRTPRAATGRSDSTPNRRPARSRAPTTRCASTSCARTPT